MKKLLIVTLMFTAFAGISMANTALPVAFTAQTTVHAHAKHTGKHGAKHHKSAKKVHAAVK